MYVNTYYKNKNINLHISSINQQKTQNNVKKNDKKQKKKSNDKSK